MGIIAHDDNALSLLFQKHLSSYDADDDSSQDSSENRRRDVEIVGLELLLQFQYHRQSNVIDQGRNETGQTPDDDIFLESDWSSLESDSSYARDSAALATGEINTSRRMRRKNSNTSSATSSVDEDSHASHIFTYANDSVDLLKKHHPSWVSFRRKRSDSLEDEDTDVDSVALAKQKLITSIETHQQRDLKIIPSSPPTLTVGPDTSGLRPVQFGNSAA